MIFWGWVSLQMKRVRKKRLGAIRKYALLKYEK